LTVFIQNLFDHGESITENRKYIELFKKYAVKQSIQHRDDIDMSLLENSVHGYLVPDMDTGVIDELDVTRATVYGIEAACSQRAWNRFNQALSGILWLISFKGRFRKDYPLPHEEKSFKSDDYTEAIFATIREMWPPSSDQPDNQVYRRHFRKLNRLQIRYAFISQLFGLGMLFDDSIHWSRFDKWSADEWMNFVKCFNSEAAQKSDLIKTWKGVRLV